MILPLIIARTSPCRLARLMQKSSGLKRRTLRKCSSLLAKDHHNVYVVLLDKAVGKLRKVRAINPDRDPKKPCVYVGMTGLTPEDRFTNHKRGIKASYYPKRYGSPTVA